MTYHSTENRECYFPPMLSNGDISFAPDAEGMLGYSARDYQDKGFAVMERFAEAVAEFGEVDKPAKLEGRNLNMFLSPKKDKK